MKRYNSFIDENGDCYCSFTQCEQGEYVGYDTAAKLARAYELMENARAMRAMDDCSNKAAQYEIEAASLYKEAMGQD